MSIRGGRTWPPRSGHLPTARPGAARSVEGDHVARSRRPQRALSSTWKADIPNEADQGRRSPGHEVADSRAAPIGRLQQIGGLELVVRRCPRQLVASAAGRRRPRAMREHGRGAGAARPRLEGAGAAVRSDAWARGFDAHRAVAGELGQLLGGAGPPSPRSADPIAVWQTRQPRRRV